MGKLKYTLYEICLVQNCNLRCRYCSTGYGRWGKEADVMSPETINKAISFMVRNGADGFNVACSGGETIIHFPSFRYFADKLIEAADKAGKKAYIEVSTNGVAVNSEIADYLVSRKIITTFSIDGDHRTTNRNRVNSSGKGMCESIIRGFKIYQNALEKQNSGETNLKAECTIDKNADLFQSLVHLFNIGFDEVIARPAVSSVFTGFDSKGAVDAYLSSYRQLVRYILDPLGLEDIIVGKYKPMFSNIHFPLIQIITRKPIRMVCGAMRSKICLNCDGSIVPCFLFNTFSDDRYVLGSVFSGIDETKVQDILREFEAFESDCDSCNCRDLCIVCYFKFIKEKNKPRGEIEDCRLIRESMKILREELGTREN
ncbi:MAG: radical SAM protein [Deltaproteobacteria bacterium]|nr:radical SAM protein [Deltaproteobacteria bacterium]